MRVSRVVAFALASALACSAHAAGYADPDGADTEAAANAAVAALGAKPARAIVPTVRTIAALRQGTADGTRALSATVTDLRRAMTALEGEETPLEVRIELPADVLFDVDKADIRPDAATALADLATVVRAWTGPVRLVGHTDSDGSDAHNLALSRRRAEAVKRWLVENAAIDPGRCSTEGLGETAPRAANDTPAGKQANRRVEVVVRKS